MNARYNNGEPITKARQEGEDWYPDYHNLLEISAYGRFENVNDLLEEYLRDYKEVFKKDCPNPEQALRWSVLHFERMQQIWKNPEEI